MVAHQTSNLVVAGSSPVGRVFCLRSSPVGRDRSLLPLLLPAVGVCRSYAPCRRSALVTELRALPALRISEIILIIFRFMIRNMHPTRPTCIDQTSTCFPPTQPTPSCFLSPWNRTMSRNVFFSPSSYKFCRMSAFLYSSQKSVVAARKRCRL